MKTENKSYGFIGLLIGASVGAAAMYFLDPTRGNQRRAVARDKFFSLTKRIRSRGEKLSTNLKNQALGVKKEFERHRRQEEVSDTLLEKRVRSAFGRKVSHARAVKVSVLDGVVTLSGPILQHEVEELISCVEEVPGVQSVKDELTKYENAGDISSLQGKGAQYFQ
nr:BON domain-containing protein [uncultured Bdellovibrio sp.]